MLSVMRDVRKLRGGSQSHLMQASDGNYYVVKFQRNPQGTRVLVNELLASRIADILHLPVPRAEVIHLPDEMAAGLTFETHAGNLPVLPGLHCAVQVVISPIKGRMYEILPPSQQRNLRNCGDLAGAAVFDFWTRNIDRRQQVYWRRCAEKKFSVSFIDNGHCFGGPDWNLIANPFIFTDSNSRHTSEWIARIEGISRQTLSALSSEIPPEWYGNARHALDAMLDALFARKSWFHPQCRSCFNPLGRPVFQHAEEEIDCLSHREEKSLAVPYGGTATDLTATCRQNSRVLEQNCIERQKLKPLFEAATMNRKRDAEIINELHQIA